MYAAQAVSSLLFVVAALRACTYTGSRFTVLFSLLSIVFGVSWRKFWSKLGHEAKPYRSLPKTNDDKAKVIQTIEFLGY